MGVLNDNLDGFGLGSSFNYINHSRVGGFYIGGLVEYNSLRQYEDSWYNQGVIALNYGYLFILPSGVLFRAGGHIGVSFDEYGADFAWRPNVSIGYKF